MSLNKIQIIGNLGDDPKLSTVGENTVANFSVATNEKWKDKQGNPQERTEWHRVAVWGKLAELCGQYLHKGSQAYVEGKTQTRKYQAKDGTDRYSTDVVAHTVTFLDPPPQRQQAQQQSQASAFEHGSPMQQGDVPF